MWNILTPAKYRKNSSLGFGIMIGIERVSDNIWASVANNNAEIGPEFVIYC